MEKVSIPGGNAFCPQTLYLYGTYREDGTPNYGLFCWCAYCAGTGGMKFVACIGEDKLTRDLIRKNGVFSATVVTKPLLQAADWCGTHPGYQFEKAQVVPSSGGEKLNVPVPVDGVWTLELRVVETLRLQTCSDSEIYICSIENVLADPQLVSDTPSFEEKLAQMQPLVTMDCRYVPVKPATLGGWGEMNK